MNDKELIQALRGAMVETGSLLCLGCGHEHSCGIHGCAVIREVAERLEALTSPPAAPLTLEELREMDEAWVWIELQVPLYGMGSGYYIKHSRFSDMDKFCCGHPNVVIQNLPYSLYGDVWLVYRIKPEGA